MKIFVPVRFMLALLIAAPPCACVLGEDPIQPRAGAAAASGALAGAEFPEPYNSETEQIPFMSAEEAAATAVLPPGFRCEVFASEPEVQQPIAMCFDERGRLWVAECYTYAEQPDRWTDDLRDRIIILEDSDGDGRADKRKVFWDQARHLTSLAKVAGGVFAICAPDLVFLADADGDDIPDTEPEVLLDGFDVDHIGHNVANGLKLGPDGWLYGRHGITNVSLVGRPDTPQSQRTKLSCSIWRYHPVRLEIEVFCNGGTNPWGLDWNEAGQLFFTNTVIGHLWHAIPGGYYTRMFGSHLNQHVYEVIPHTADHYHWDTGSESWNDIRRGVSDSTSALGGGHAHMGCLIYKGKQWPREYFGNLFTCNLHGRRINRDVLERAGCGYVAHHGQDFMLMKDPYFRGLDLLTGPDGQMWINDWSDVGECHDNTGLHRTSGRIYRIVYEGEPPAAPQLGEPESARPDWFTIRGHADFGRREIEAWIASRDEAKRALGVRYLSEDYAFEPATPERLTQLARGEASGLVRLEIAAALQRLPVERRIEVASALCDRSEDAEDRQQPLMIWYGLADAVARDAPQAIRLAMASKIAKVRTLIARRLCESLDEQPQIVEDLLALSLEGSSEIRRDVLRGMEAALRGRARAVAPDNWTLFSTAIKRHGSAEELASLQELSLLFGDGRTRDALLETVRDANADPNARRSALRSLMRQPTQELLPLLKASVNDKVLSTEAVRGLAYYDGADVASRLLDRWQRSNVDRDAAIDALVARPRHAAALLEAMSAGAIPRQAVSPVQARQIDNHGVAQLSQRLREVWGNIRETPEEKQRELEGWKRLLTTERLAAADPSLGKAIFLKQCASCHQLYGDGRKVGPNLTGSDRHNLDYVLSNIVDPSAVVAADYRMSVFAIDDGRVISGVVAAESDRSLTVQTQQEPVELDKQQIVDRQLSEVSLMPEGILKQLSPQEVTDLVAYLMSQSPL